MRSLTFLLSICFLWVFPSALAGQNRERDECGRLPGLSMVQSSTPNVKGPAAQPQLPSSSDADVLRIETDLVIAEFEVRDKRGRRVSGLQEGDFRVEEDGEPQTIEVFSFGKASTGIGRSIILIIDYSQSQSPYISTSVEAAKVLVDMLDPDDKVALVTDDVQLIENFTSDKVLLKERLEGLRIRSLEGKYGKSRQLSALYAAVSELFASSDKRPVVILQTDGDEFGPLNLPLRLRTIPCGSGSFSWASVKSAIEKAGTTIYAVIPGVRLNGRSGHDFQLVKNELGKLFKHEAKLKKQFASYSGQNLSDRFVQNWLRSRIRDTAAIEELSAETGGTSQYLESPENAADVYRSILDEMNQRYLIGYYPTNKARDGRKRSIRVSFRSGINYSVLGKTSYIPRDDSNSK